MTPEQERKYEAAQGRYRRALTRWQRHFQEHDDCGSVCDEYMRYREQFEMFGRIMDRIVQPDKEDTFRPIRIN